MEPFKLSFNVPPTCTNTLIPFHLLGQAPVSEVAFFAVRVACPFRLCESSVPLRPLVTPPCLTEHYPDYRYIASLASTVDYKLPHGPNDTWVVLLLETNAIKLLICPCVLCNWATPSSLGRLKWSGWLSLNLLGLGLLGLLLGMCHLVGLKAPSVNKSNIYTTLPTFCNFFLYRY